MPDPLTLLSGIAIVFAFTPWEFTPLIWICLIPWFAALERAPNRKAAFKQGVWLSVIMSVGGFYWVASVLREFGGLPWALAILGLFLYSLGGQPQFLIFGPIYSHLKKTNLKKNPRSSVAFAVLMALLYTGIDWILPKLFVDTLGHAFYASPKMRQAADLGGAALLTFLVYFVNDTLWEAYKALRRRREHSFLPALRSLLPQIALALSFVGAIWVYGWKRSEQIEQLTNAALGHVRAGVIQANIGDFDKVAAERGIRGAAAQILRTYFTLSDEALQRNPKPDLLIWPETSYPSTFRTPQNTEEFSRDQMLERFVRERETTLLFGGYDRHGGKDFNAFFFLSPHRMPGLLGEGDLKIYRKNVLLMFGEYLPGADQMPWMKMAFPQVANFGRGDGPEAVEVKLPPSNSLGSVRIGPIICYEALFPNYVIAAAVAKGAQMILNITNDSWFGPYGEPELHLSLTIFRSIETRLPQLRATNTGISALILPSGEITHASGVGKQEVLDYNVPILAPIPTLIKSWGDWFGPFALIVGLAMTIRFWRRITLEIPST